jgi:hypothetical protein
MGGGEAIFPPLPSPVFYCPDTKVVCTVRGSSAGDLVAGDRTGGKTAGATRSDLDGVFEGGRATRGLDTFEHQCYFYNIL